MEKSQLLILGNGFDLHCGLKSSYQDFFYSTILDNENCKKSGVKRIREGVNNFWEQLLFIYFKEYGDKNYNWCDIEQIIKDTLLLIYFGDDSSSKTYNYGLWKTAMSYVKSGKDIQFSSSYENKPVRRYIVIALFKFFYSIVGQGYSSEKELQLMSSFLIGELNKFENIFCKYLKDNITNPQNIKDKNNDYILRAVNFIFALIGFANQFFIHSDQIISRQLEDDPTKGYRLKKSLNSVFEKLKNVYILSFNYTMIFDILKVESPCIYANVHGKLCNKECKGICNATSVIFGIDDSVIQSQDSNTEMRLFSKTYRKMLNNGNPLNILPSKDNMVEIKFYGHSLSEADYSYFQSIFDYYDLYSNCKVSLIFYYSKGYEQYDAIYKLISEYGKSLTNKQQGKNLTHKLLLENRLNIKEIIDCT